MTLHSGEHQISNLCGRIVYSRLESCLERRTSIYTICPSLWSRTLEESARAFDETGCEFESSMVVFFFSEKDESIIHYQAPKLDLWWNHNTRFLNKPESIKIWGLTKPEGVNPQPSTNWALPVTYYCPIIRKLHALTQIASLTGVICSGMEWYLPTMHNWGGVVA